MKLDGFVNTVAARQLNENCACTAIDQAQLSAIWSGKPDQGVFGNMAQTHPHLVAAAPVYVSKPDVLAMLRTIRAAERVSRLPGWGEAANAPDGVFMGYDFHLSAGGPQLIEINTNAGGAFINLAMAGALQNCCAAMDVSKTASPRNAAARIVKMFREAFAESGRTRPLRRVAILDEDPQRQFLYPEFHLAVALLEAAGIAVTIAAPDDLAMRDGSLMQGDAVIDMVYNRLTDFSFSAPGNAHLLKAWQASLAYFSPGPLAHRRLADKGNLVRFSDDEFLRNIGAQDVDRCLLAGHVPKTVNVTEDNAAQLWAARDGLYFKPLAGHAGKAVYRGAKMTGKVWDMVRTGGFVAQNLVAPPERLILVNGRPEIRKFDIRAFTWKGRLLLIAARIYQGQTTNFRSIGGGFAPVLFA